MRSDLEQALNKKLETLYKGKLHARRDGDRVFLEGSLRRRKGIVTAEKRARRILRRAGFRQGALVNKIELEGAVIPALGLPEIRDRSLEGRKPDVLIIGGGITGAALARELSRYRLDILLIEKEHRLAPRDSCGQQSLVHSGADLKKGSPGHRYTLRGNVMFGSITGELGVAFKRSGQYFCFSNPLLVPLLYLSLGYWKWLRVRGVRVILKRELRRREPRLGGARAALFFPSAGLVCPRDLISACAENAQENGARISLNTAALGFTLREGRIVRVETNRGALYPRAVVNAAGIFAGDVAALAGDEFYSIPERRAPGQDVRESSRRILNGLSRPRCGGNFVAERGRRTLNLIHAAGAGYPGLTAAPAIAEDAARLTLEVLEELGLEPRKNSAFNPLRRAKQRPRTPGTPAPPALKVPAEELPPA
ncbi:MAG: FAD-dependent oxidoreductase [Spirochaetaceae bacterium]|jgi:glycerol-3-phosphate dehydrogenase|nr:FAD-dependent oxidoreductase [Spirochaetaceae bacterium]